MENTHQRSIDLLNGLVEINNDRIAGYQQAIKETNETALKTLFMQMVETSKKCRSELSSEISKMGGDPIEGTAASGKLYRVWMDIRSALTNKDRKAILSSCEYGEDFAVHAYEDTLLSDDLMIEHEYLLKKQYALIKAEHDKIRSMRDASVKVDRRE